LNSNFPAMKAVKNKAETAAPNINANSLIFISY
jgi:hypothetical protein